MDDNTPVFPMAIACNLTGLHPQTIRKYEIKGFIKPARINGLRFFSQHDISELNHITYLHKKKRLNIGGITLVFSIRQIIDDSSIAPSTRLNKIKGLL